ncbi:MAG: HAMP domain-containing histidine kinase [Lachnospiraceae bacterium]|nr:HAMP domain-containing histidine kinase [Lachnospiraceae bacterium]
MDADGTVLYEGGAVFAISGSENVSVGTLTNANAGLAGSVDSGENAALNNAETSLFMSLDEEQNVGYSLLREASSTYVLVICKSSIGIYIETVQDISSVFEARDAMYARYQVGVLAISALVGGVTLLVLFVTMRNMQKLSKATRQFARGEYETRVDIRNRDEIGMLSEDFNWMADEMSGQMEKLRDEVRRQEEFTSAFAHELKTPLTSIIGYADTIRQMELTPEETDMCANYIFQQGKRLQSLSYKLLEMTMAGNQTIERKAVRVPELFRDVELAVRAVLIEKSVKLLVEVEPGVVLGDKDLLSSVFINLIDNARKASQPGSRIWVTGTVLSERRGEYCLTVEDEAGGLPEEELSRITDAFYMVDKSRARKEGGAGLGLALCQKIIDAHQGSWRIENVPEQGLRVTVLLAMPQADARERARERKRLQQKKTRSQAQKKEDE